MSFSPWSPDLCISRRVTPACSSQGRQARIWTAICPPLRLGPVSPPPSLVSRGEGMLLPPVLVLRPPPLHASKRTSAFHNPGRRLPLPSRQFPAAALLTPPLLDCASQPVSAL